MFNLLPTEEKEGLAYEYNLRLVVVVLVFLMMLGGVALISLVPSFFILYQKENFLTNREADLKKVATSVSGDNQATVLKLVREKITVLDAEKLPTYLYELLGKILDNKIAGIRLSGVEMSEANKGIRRISILGKAKNRDVLFSFKQTLEREPRLSAVEVPPSNFASSADINFSILANTK
ncbi:MAG: hypothetical protein V4467_03240 [Patescibacteria group bacterium]